MSFLRIDRAETNFGDEVDTYDDKVYAKARDLLQEMIREGNFVVDKEECYYVYELVMEGRSQTGLVACASIDDYLNNVIKKLRIPGKIRSRTGYAMWMSVMLDRTNFSCISFHKGN